MARVKFGSIVTEIRGSVGGTTFQVNKYGFTAKNKSVNVRPNTVKQSGVKSIFSFSVKAWRNLTETARGNWNTFAANFPQYTKNDDTVPISGFNAFVKWHTAYYLATGVTTLPADEPITSSVTSDSAAPALTLSGGVLTLVPNWSIASGAWFVNWFLSSPRLDSQLFFGINKRFMASSFTGTASINLTAAYIQAFGVLPAIGDAVNVSSVLYNIDGGYVLSPVNYRVTVM